MNFSSLSDLYGDEVSEVTIQHLATMKSGIPDYDTAIPDKHLDSLRATVYANPERDYSPVELISFPWITTQTLDFPPGQNQSYSSTNFVLLGIVLSQGEWVSCCESLSQRVGFVC